MFITMIVSYISKFNFSVVRNLSNESNLKMFYVHMDKSVYIFTISTWDIVKKYHEIL